MALTAYCILLLAPSILLFCGVLRGVALTFRSVFVLPRLVLPRLVDRAAASLLPAVPLLALPTVSLCPSVCAPRSAPKST